MLYGEISREMLSTHAQSQRKRRSWPRPSTGAGSDVSAGAVRFMRCSCAQELCAMMALHGCEGDKHLHMDHKHLYFEQLENMPI